MSKIAVVVCNRCEELGKPTRPYVIQQGRRKAEIDLCEDDSAYLEEFLNGTPREPRVVSAPAKRAAKTTPRGRAKVVSMDEIAALKR